MKNSEGGGRLVGEFGDWEEVGCWDVKEVRDSLLRTRKTSPAPSQSLDVRRGVWTCRNWWVCGLRVRLLLNNLRN